MEIHKPKPVHSWYGFLKEYAIIVLGVVTAITLENLVERWNWSAEVKDGRQAILEEIRANNENVFAFRIAIAPCVQKEFDEADMVLAALGAARKTSGMTRFSPAPGALVRDSEWQSERASQVLTHFPRAELALMSRYYGQMASMQTWAVSENDAFYDLASLQHPPAGIVATDLIKFRNGLHVARAYEFSFPPWRKKADKDQRAAGRSRSEAGRCAREKLLHHESAGFYTVSQFAGFAVTIAASWCVQFIVKQESARCVVA